MSSICSDKTKCPNGNCIGCRNGVPYCQDPRCYPNCSNCKTSTPSNSNWILVTVILVLLGIMLILAFFIGYDWYMSKKKANEPKTVNINKHFHTIKESQKVVAPQVVSQIVPPQIVPPQVVPSQIVISQTPLPFQAGPQPPLAFDIPVPSQNPRIPDVSVSTEGLKLSVRDLPMPDMNLNSRMSIGGAGINFNSSAPASAPGTPYSSLSCNRPPIQGIE